MGELSPIFHARPPRPPSAHERVAHAGSSFFSFSFHSLTAPLLSHPHSLLLTPPSRVDLRRVALVLALIASPSPFRVAPRRPVATCRPSSCRPSPRIAPRYVSPSSRRPSLRVALVASPLVMCRPIATRRPRRVAQAAHLLTDLVSAAEMEGCEWVGWKCGCRQ